MYSTHQFNARNTSAEEVKVCVAELSHEQQANQSQAALWAVMTVAAFFFSIAVN